MSYRRKLPAQTAEEIFHQLAAFLFEYAKGHNGLGMQRCPLGSIVREETSFSIRCTVDDSPYMRPTQGSGTHRTRFDGDIQRAVRQILSS